MTSSTASNTTLCPGCGEPYIQGEDYCSNCHYDLRRIGVPTSGEPGPGKDFGAPLTEVRIPAPHSLAPDAPVSDAVTILRDDPSGAVVVVEAMLVKVVRRPVTHSASTPIAKPMRDVMTADPVILRDSDTIATALNKMAIGGFRHVPLVHGDTLIGVVTASDLMQWFMQKYID